MIPQRLVNYIEQSHKTGKHPDGRMLPCLSFADYMAFCLYDEQYGYYRSREGGVRVGREGDFYTSVSIGTVLGDCVAQQLRSLCERIEQSVHLYEWGGGRGLLSEHILSRELVDNVVNFTFVEDYPEHVEQARARLRAFHVEFVSSQQLTFDDHYPIVFANELLDAFPVQRFVKRGTSIRELCVSVDQNRLIEVECEQLDERAVQQLSQDNMIEPLEQGQQVEVSVAMLDWLEQTFSSWQQGTVFWIDYGHDAAELTATHRMQGTLLTYYKHEVGTDPYVRVGEQDLTAHVNFTAVQRVLQQIGFTIETYQTQLEFLLNCGILQQLQSHDGRNPFSEEAKRNRSIRQLLLSDGMSTTFKVLIASKRSK